MNLLTEVAKTKAYRVTDKRRRILQVIEANAPLTADEIYLHIRQDCQINLSTVYRNIKTLLEMGLIRKILTSEGRAEQYEIADHQCEHSVECVHCGATVNFSGCLFNQMIKTIEAQTDFQVERHNLEIYGVCPQCKGKSKGKASE
ncbi:MAG: Fur family transcriptional regulator [Bacillota bacterium]|jgi:Fe2+ or Zn2+ uptake regulation protein